MEAVQVLESRAVAKEPYGMTNKGLRISLIILEIEAHHVGHLFESALYCFDGRPENGPVVICLVEREFWDDQNRTLLTRPRCS